MALVTLPSYGTDPVTVNSSNLNGKVDPLATDYNGNIQNVNIAAGAGIVYSKLTLTDSVVNADINSAAAIVDTKLAQITTAAKISGAAITLLTSVPSGAGALPLANGGAAAVITAVNGGIVYSTATVLAVSAAGSTGQILRSAGAGVPVWTTATYPATAGTSGKILVSDGTNIISSTPTFPNASATSRKIIVSDGTNWVASTETAAVPGSSGNLFISDGTNWTSAAATFSNVPVGSVVQLVNTQTGAVATGTTVIPDDDTIPQITEGDQYMTLAITPKATTHNLRITVVANLTTTSANDAMIVALFQDATAGALAAVQENSTSSSFMRSIVFSHFMAAGTTSSTTFRVRAGCPSANTTTFNGVSSARKYGGVIASSITIEEVKA